MTKVHRTTIIPIGNSKGIRIPKDYLNALGETSQVELQKTGEGILIKPASTVVPPLSEWNALFAQADTSLEEDLAEWDATLPDGLETEAPYE